MRIASAAFNAARKVATPFLSLAFMIGSEVLAASVVSLLIFGLLSEFWDRFKINDAWVKPIESVFAGIFLIASVIMVVVGLALALVFFGLKFVLYIASKLSWESVAFRLPAGVGVFVARIAVAAVLTFSAYKLWEITRPPASQASTQIGAANKSESKLPEAIEPIPALTFIDAPVTCSSTRWKLAERMQVEAPLEDCSIYSSADYLVLVGSASPRGGTPSEPLRAKDRGYNLTKQVKQLKPSAETKVFVLNKGIEQNEALETAPPLQAYEGRSVVDSAKVQEASFIRDFSKYLSDPSKVTPHSNCELYRVTFGRGDSDPKMQLVTGWKCPH